MAGLSDNTLSQREFTDISGAIVRITVNLDKFTAAAKMAGRQINRFAFSIWLTQQPRWLRPLMRFAYWAEEKVGLH